MRNFIVGVIVIVALAVGAWLTFRHSHDEEIQSPSHDTDTAVVSTFSWSFSKSDTLNLDGIPGTVVTLVTRYTDGLTVPTLIDTVGGGCNELDGANEGQLAGTAVVQCYGAGLGQRYRVMENEGTYVVQRKLFEEGLPDRDPVRYGYETIAEL